MLQTFCHVTLERLMEKTKHFDQPMGYRLVVFLSCLAQYRSGWREAAQYRSLGLKTFECAGAWRSFFYLWLPAARVFWAVRPSVSYNEAKRTIPVCEQQQKHFQSLAKTMKRTIGTWRSKMSFSKPKAKHEH